MTKALIHYASVKLTECFILYSRMKRNSIRHGQFDRNDVMNLILNLQTVIDYLSKANEKEFANSVNTISQYLERGDFNSAELLFAQVLPSLAKLDRTEQKEVQVEEKPHLHIVSESECPHCRKNIPKDSRFCPYCSRDIRHSRCPNCGKDVEIGWKFCVHCTRQL